MATATPDLQWGDLVGKPFKIGGRGPDAYDCYGLVSEAMRRLGRTAPDYTSPEVHEQMADLVIHARSSPDWERCERPEPYSVGLIRIGRHVSHVVLVLPFGRVLHSWEPAGGVVVERLENWALRVAAYYRLVKEHA